MSIAIVIPAYKDTFLTETLESISNQTDKDFTLYIGDDNSPYQLLDIVNKYKEKINIKYTRFNDNLGGNNLVSQWERCIALVDNEEWIWLFSDDDYMPPQCIETFKKELSKNKHYDLYRFNVEVINRERKVIKKVIYPNLLSSLSLYKGKVLGKLDCYVVEYIFSRKIYKEQGGFIPFDLAWGSDLATWVKYGMNNKIKTIAYPHISWRSSGENISTIESEKIVCRKLHALISFLKWGEIYFKEHNEKVSTINDIGFIKRITYYSTFIPIKTSLSFIREVL